MKKCLWIQNTCLRMQENVYEFQKIHGYLKYLSFPKTNHEVAKMLKTFKKMFVSL